MLTDAQLIKLQHDLDACGSMDFYILNAIMTKYSTKRYVEYSLGPVPCGELPFGEYLNAQETQLILKIYEEFYMTEFTGCKEEQLDTNRKKIDSLEKYIKYLEERVTKIENNIARESLSRCAKVKVEEIIFSDYQLRELIIQFKPFLTGYILEVIYQRCLQRYRDNYGKWEWQYGEPLWNLMCDKEKEIFLIFMQTAKNWPKQESNHD